MLYLRSKKKSRPSYLGNEGSYRKSVKGGPPLSYHAESKYALEKWKGHLPSYLNRSVSV